jgi:large subunit ribosomal protein L25
LRGLALPAAGTSASLQSAAVSGDRLKLEVQERELRGSRNARRLRAQGLVPGVLYGKGHARAIAVPERDLRTAVTGPSGLHAILDVVLEGQKTVHPSVLADVQRDPIRGTVSHIDLREVRLDQPIQASVVIRVVGESEGVKAGGVLSVVTRELHVEALPMEVPEHIDVEVSALAIGDALRLEDLPLIENVRFLDDPHETVMVTVSAPRAVVEPEVEEEEAEEGEEAAEEEAEGAAAEEASAAELSGEE